MSVLLLLAALLGGVVLSYAYDDRSRMPYRLASGMCVGQVALGLAGYALSAWWGLGRPAVFTAALIVAVVPALLVRGAALRLRQELPDALRRGLRDLKEGRPGLRLRVALFVSAVVLILPLLDRSMYWKDDGIFTSYVDYYADMTLHTGFIMSWVSGDNFPPEHPEFGGTRLAYPFVADFIAAMLMAAGATLRAAIFMQNVVLLMALIVVLYGWARGLTGSRRAALLVPALVLLNGGLGFTMLVRELPGAAEGVWHYLTHLPHDYSAYEHLYRWTNSFINWFVPMRSMLLGTPLFLIVTGLWWRALGYEAPEMPTERVAGPAASGAPSGHRRRRRVVAKASASVAADVAAPVATPAAAPARTAPSVLFSPDRIMLGAGAVAGLLPLSHAHTFVTLMGLGGLFALMTRRFKTWFLFGVVASVLALPQILWAVSGTSAEAENFFGVHFGWSGHEERDKWVSSWLETLGVKPPGASAVLMPALERLGRGEDTAVSLAVAAGHLVAMAWYWFLNTSVFIPLLVLALAWKRGGRIVRQPLRVAFLPFWLCFLVPNVMKLAPWEWDNIKVLMYWFLPAVPLVALLLVRLSRWRPVRFRPSGPILATALFVLMTLSGALDIWRALTPAVQWCVFDSNQVAIAQLIQKTTPPRAMLLTSPVHNHAFLLAGRRSFLGYTGTLWTHGIVYNEREEVLKQIYKGEANARALLEAYKIDYVVVGPLERDNPGSVNMEFFEKNFPRVGEARDAVIYKVGS